MVDVTTSPNEIWSLGRNPVVTRDLQNFLGVKNDSSLFHPKQLRERLDALDDLDIRFGDFTAARYLNDTDARIANLAKAMRARLEAVNTVLYESIRSEIVRGAPPHILLQWIQAPASRGETASGLGYDYRDEVVTGVFQLREREGFIYFDDDGDLVALRVGNWKAVFMEQRCEGTLRIWAEPFTALRIPKIYNLRTDPYERADTTSNTYWDWYMSKGYMLMAAQGLVGRFLETFKDFPPRQKAASFTIDQAMQKMESGFAGGSAKMPKVA